MSNIKNTSNNESMQLDQEPGGWWSDNGVLQMVMMLWNQDNGSFDWMLLFGHLSLIIINEY